MKTKKLFFTLLYFFSFKLSLVNAEIKPYQTIDNSGLNKQERIESIDKYLVELVVNLKNMESKIDDNGKKLKSLEDMFKDLAKAQKDSEIKKQVPPSEKDKDKDKDTLELQKIKADIMSLKNRDIEEIKQNIYEIKDSLKILHENRQGK